jgi:hypothetical protein
VRVYALTSSQVPSETLDLFLTREAADAELREIVQDEREWGDVLTVVPIEFDWRDAIRGAKLPRGFSEAWRCLGERASIGRALPRAAVERFARAACPNPISPPAQNCPSENELTPATMHVN